MPIHIKTFSGGSFSKGKLRGAGAIYTSDDSGNGTIKIGNFVNGLLHDSDGQLIEYTNTSFTKYQGNFVNDQLDGEITVTEYKDSSEESEEEKKVNGVGTSGQHGRKWLHKSETVNEIVATRKVKQYSSGVDSGTTSTESHAVVLCLEKTKFNNRFILTDFCVEEP